MAQDTAFKLSGLIRDMKRVNLAPPAIWSDHANKRTKALNNENRPNLANPVAPKYQ